MLKINRQVAIDGTAENVRSLYDRHAGMLLGYLIEIVRDRKLAEELLVKLFCDLSLHFNEINWNGTNSWCQLQKFALTKLKEFNYGTKQLNNSSNYGTVAPERCNKFLDQLTDEQKVVFCNVYYHGKSTYAISIDLNKPEDVIRKTLKEAFAIMRKRGEN
jgi:DNA-directed RNA polymerase specialized sigma24 family protein